MTLHMYSSLDVLTISTSRDVVSYSQLIPLQSTWTFQVYAGKKFNVSSQSQVLLVNKQTFVDNIVSNRSQRQITSSQIDYTPAGVHK